MQASAHQAADLAKEKSPLVREKMSEAAGVAADKAGAAASKVRPGGSSKTDGHLEEKLNPDNVALQDDPYPKGDLP